MCLVIKAINLAIRFLLELSLLFSLGYWGFHVEHGYLVKIGLGVGIPIVVAVIWGMLLSPKALIKVPVIGRVAIEVILFGSAVSCLYDSGFTIQAIILGFVFILNRYYIIKWRQ